MGMTENRCQRCGGVLDKVGEATYKCKYCGATYDDTTARENAKQMQALFDEAKLETINNLRRNLYDATTAEYISSTDVKNACVELKKYLPDDFRANFYEIAVGNNEKRLTSAIRKIDVEANFDEVDNIIRFLIKSLQPGFLLELNNLVERAYKGRDLQTYEKYATEISVQAEKVQLGVYETKLPREVFVAYSSKDMDKVSELVEVLEAQGLKCFVAARNLRHGKGSVENYDKALKEAIDHCKSFVFVSSLNSRSLSCDALEIEIPYVQKQDIENAPAEYRNNYTAIPHKYKKPRVEYRIQSSTGFNAADQITGEFFDGYEWVLSPDEVAVRIMKQLVAAPVADEPKESTSDKKYCINCGQENHKSRKACSACGRNEFVDDIGDFIKIKNRRDIEERNRREKEAAAAKSTSGKDGKKKKKRGCGTFILIGIALIFVLGIIGVIADRVEGSQYETPMDTDVPSYIINGNGNGDYFIGGIEDVTLKPAETEKNPDEQEETVISGSWGSVNYTFNRKTGVLVVSGSGEIPPRNNMNSIPWESGYAYNGLREIIVEEGVTKVGDCAFASINDLKKVTLASSVKEIGEYAFQYCPITEFTAPGVEKVGQYAFENCDQLKSISLENALLIQRSVFVNCHALESVNLPAVNSIAAEAFYNCKALLFSNVTLGDNCTTIEANAFDMASDPGLLTNEGSVYVGKYLIKVHSDVIGRFEVKPGTLGIAPEAFTGCQSITEIILPESIRWLGNSAMMDAMYVRSLIYTGTAEQWEAVSFGEMWDSSLGAWSSNGGYQMTFLNGEYDPDALNALAAFEFLKNGNKDEYYVAGFLSDRLTEDQLNIKIPATYMGLPVTRIGGGVFQSSKITGVEIPASITEIDESAFDNCTALQYVTIEEGSQLKKIGSNAFSKCASLTEFTIPASVTTVGSFAFSECTGLETLTFGEGINISVIPSCMARYTAITSISIPASVQEIQNEAFYGCESLASISFAADCALTTIGSQSFTGCTGVTSLTLPASLTYMESNAFDNCSIKTLTVPTTVSLNFWYSPWNSVKTLIINGGDTIVGNNYQERQSVETIIIGDSVKTISQSAFSDWGSLKSITIGKNVTSIGNSAICNCQNLETITFLGSSVEEAGNYAFSNNPKLKSITLPEGVTTLGTNVFYNCQAIEEINLPESLETIGNEAFYACTALTSIDLKNITAISDRMFYESGITSLIIPDSVTYIGSQVFYGCVDLVELVIPATLTADDVHTSAFEYFYSIKKLTIPAGLANRFPSNNKENLEEVIINGGSKIEAYSFNNCTKLKKVTLPEGVETILKYAFSNCYSLLSIEIPSTLTGCAIEAFENCYRLAEVVDKSQGQTVATNAIIPNLKHVSTDASIIDYVDDFAFLTVDSESYLIGYVGEATDIVLPESYNGGNYKLNNNAFYNTSAESIVINGVDEIQDSAFEGCGSIVKVVIGDSVKRIGAYAFKYCNNLRVVDIGNGVTAIGEQAFYNCSSLISIKLGSALTTISGNAFEYCSSLDNITIPASVETIEPYAFSQCTMLSIVVFEYQGGYRVTGYENYDLTLSNSVMNASYLTSNYIGYTWTKIK